MLVGGFLLIVELRQIRTPRLVVPLIHAKRQAMLSIRQAFADQLEAEFTIFIDKYEFPIVVCH